MPAHVTISIAMATYNGEEYIREQLDSIAAQTVPPLELVVCDDGSSDRTVEIIEEFAATAPFPVRLYRNGVNLGYADNFLKAASLCRGQWIAFSDQDDVWFGTKLERVQEVIMGYAEDELVMIGHSSLLADENLNRTGQRFPDYKRDTYVKNGAQFGFFSIYGFSMISRATILRDFDVTLRPRGEWLHLSHDQWLGMLANAVGDIAYISEPLAIWRRHDLSLTRAPAPSSLIHDTKIAALNLSPVSYAFSARKAKECAESFQKIGEVTADIKLRKRIKLAAERFHRLAIIYIQREQIYASANGLERVVAFLKMNWRSAYFGHPYCSLGGRAFAKDAVFVLGILGRAGRRRKAQKKASENNRLCQ